MTQRVLVAVLTIVVFLAGYGVRVWTEPRQPVPPVPASIAQDFARPITPVGAKANRQIDRAKLVADIEKLRPQIIAYTARVEEINAEFDRDFIQVLRAEQREKFAADQKKRAAWDAKRQASRKPLSDEDILREEEGPFSFMYYMITVNPSLEWRTREYGLDPAQQGATRSLLEIRRTKFITLFDATPHPSIRLSRLAPLIERVAPAAAK
jgi:hypothetical protein